MLSNKPDFSFRFIFFFQGHYSPWESYQSNVSDLSSDPGLFLPLFQIAEKSIRHTFINENLTTLVIYLLKNRKDTKFCFLFIYSVYSMAPVSSVKTALWTSNG